VETEKVNHYETPFRTVQKFSNLFSPAFHLYCHNKCA